MAGPPETGEGRRRIPGRARAASVVVLLSAAAWAAWLGWDHGYYYDPEIGAYQGPYRSWQVAGSVATLLVAAVLGGLLLRPLPAALCVAVPFTVLWTTDAALRDETGLFGAGAVMIAVGLFLGSLVTGALARLLRRSLAR